MQGAGRLPQILLEEGHHAAALEHLMVEGVRLVVDGPGRMLAPVGAVPVPEDDRAFAVPRGDPGGDGVDDCGQLRLGGRRHRLGVAGDPQQSVGFLELLEQQRHQHDGARENADEILEDFPEQVPDVLPLGGGHVLVHQHGLGGNVADRNDERFQSLKERKVRGEVTLVQGQDFRLERLQRVPEVLDELDCPLDRPDVIRLAAEQQQGQPAHQDVQAQGDLIDLNRRVRLDEEMDRVAKSVKFYFCLRCHP